MRAFNIFCIQTGGYYTIEQRKSRLRIIALNTNYMRHDPKYFHSNPSAIRENTENERKHYYSGAYDERRHHNTGRNRGHHNSDDYIEPMGSVSSTNHGAEKQWEWLENILDNSYKNKETVSKPIYLFYSN